MSILILAGMIMLYAAVVDFKTRRIPDFVPAGILLCGVLRILSGLLTIPETAIGMFANGLPLLLFAVFAKSGKAMGGGDVKLCAALGFMLGFYSGYFVIALGLFFSLFYAKVTARQKNSSVPLAPFLSMGYGVVFITIILERWISHV